MLSCVNLVNSSLVKSLCCLASQAENQAIDRVHRIGQEHEVTVHQLYMAGMGHNCYTSVPSDITATFEHVF